MLNLINDKRCWIAGAVLTGLLAAGHLLNIVDWSWWTAGVPIYLLVLWLVVSAASLHFNFVAALGILWIGAIVPLNAADVIDWPWWSILLLWGGSVACLVLVGLWRART